MTEPHYTHDDPALRPPHPSEYPWTPVPAPRSETSRVSLSMLDSSKLDGPADAMSSFAKEGERRVIPSFSFLIEHPDQGVVLFDLGCREDPENFMPVTKPTLEKWKVQPHPHPIARLQQRDYDLSRIKTLIISHKHFDHFGNLDTVASFNPEVVVGPGTLETIGKGYPEDEKSPWPSKWLNDCRMIELPPAEEKGSWTGKVGDKGRKWQPVGCFQEGVDWFEDGSFWLINAPGHTTGQMLGLARVTTSPESYVLLGADAAHSQDTYLPVPIKTDERGTEPVNKDGKVPFLEDVDRGVKDIGGLTRMSAEDNIMVLLAHEAEAEFLPRWPEKLDGWMEEGWKLKKEEGVNERARQRAQG